MYIWYVAVGGAGALAWPARRSTAMSALLKLDGETINFCWVHCDIYEVVDDTSAHISMHDAYGGEGAPARGCSCGGGVQRYSLVPNNIPRPLGCYAGGHVGLDRGDHRQPGCWAEPCEAEDKALRPMCMY